jgi:ribonuclease P protein component
VPRAVSAFQPDFRLNQRFPKSYRLRSKADFSAMRSGRRINCRGIRLVYRCNHLGFSRLGLAVSRKYGNAIQRNHFKRQLREVFRKSCFRSRGIDILAIPRGNAAGMHDAAHDFSEALAMIRDQK